MDDISMAPLSYDDTVPYEEQTAAEGTERGLADRISSARLYLLSDTTKSSKRKRDDEAVLDLDNEEALDDAGLPYRPNALFISGTPVAFLPTARIFAYANHFDARPLGLEWVDDTSCVLVFDNALTAKISYRRLVKSDEEEADSEGSVTAKSIPMAVWPAEERINKTLGKGDGLKGTIRLRYARNEDVKKKNARQDSNFYKKHGEFAGKEMYGGDAPHEGKRRKREDDALSKARLDAELDDFLADEGQLEEEEEDKTEGSNSPPSRMRSDYIAKDGRTLLERTSIIRFHGEAETPLLGRLTESRPQRPLPSRRKSDERRSDSNGRRSQNGRERKTQQELDDELDAFLNARD